MISNEEVAFLSNWSCNWEAINAGLTFFAVLVALFHNKLWECWNRSNPKLVVSHHRNPVSGLNTFQSIISLAFQNSGIPIQNAKVFWVASEWRDRTNNNLVQERVFPELIFEWIINKINELPSRSIILYGQESFDFLFSTQESDLTWKPSLVLGDLVNEGPLKAFLNRSPTTSFDPNFECRIYLQLRGTNFRGGYWPVWIRYDSGTNGGWIVHPEEQIDAKKFLEIFPNLADQHFRTQAEKFRISSTL